MALKLWDVSFVTVPHCRVCDQQEADHHSGTDDDKKAHNCNEDAKKKNTYNSQTADADKRSKKHRLTPITDNHNKQNETNTKISDNHKSTNNCPEGNNPCHNQTHW